MWFTAFEHPVPATTMPSCHASAAEMNCPISQIFKPNISRYLHEALEQFVVGCFLKCPLLSWNPFIEFIAHNFTATVLIYSSGDWFLHAIICNPRWTECNYSLSTPINNMFYFPAFSTQRYIRKQLLFISLAIDLEPALHHMRYIQAHSIGATDNLIWSPSNRWNEHRFAISTNPRHEIIEMVGGTTR